MKGPRSCRATGMVASALLTLLASDARAAFEDRYGYSARAMALGNAYVSLVDDSTAAYHNPAALGHIERSQISAGFVFGAPDLEAVDRQTGERMESPLINQNQVVLGGGGRSLPGPRRPAVRADGGPARRAGRHRPDPRSGATAVPELRDDPGAGHPAGDRLPDLRLALGRGRHRRLPRRDLRHRGRDPDRGRELRRGAGRRRGAGGGDGQRRRRPLRRVRDGRAAPRADPRPPDRVSRSATPWRSWPRRTSP